MDRSSNDTGTLAVAARLTALREALGLSQAAIGRLCGITYQAWNNYEKAVNRIALNQAVRVCVATGATLDWIYRGDGRGLPVEIATKIQEAARETPKRRA